MPKDKGLIYLSDDSVHQCKIEAVDAYGNSSVLQFTCKSDFKNSIVQTLPEYTNLINWDVGGNYTIKNYSVYIPPKALYQDLYFSLAVAEGEDGIFSDTLLLHKPSEPLHLGITLKANLDSVDKKLQDKLLFARINSSGKLMAEGGEFYNGVLSVITRNFGKYLVTFDTIPPTIQPLSFKPKSQYSSGQTITFKTEDDLSGIDTYKALIDGNWALLEYDAKSGTLTYQIDPERLTKGKSHNLEIVMTDNQQNISRYESRFEF